jgi:hypothetical protein
MVKTKRWVTGVAMVAIGAALTGCGSSADDGAREALGQTVDVSIEAMSESLLALAPSDELDPGAFATVASYQALDGLSDLPAGESSSTMYCLERDADGVNACVFYPMTSSLASGLSAESASVYGCAILSGRIATKAVAVVDTDCPDELVSWFVAKPSVKDAEAISISSLMTAE